MSLEIDDIVNRARRYCAYQERCEKEVEKKLKGWKVKPSDTEKVITQLREEGFLNGERYARSYARGHLLNKQWGKTRITYELKGKGIPEQLINKVLEEIDKEEYRNVLRKLLLKKNKELKEEDPFVKKKKLVSFAMGKGFEYELIKEVLSFEC